VYAQPLYPPDLTIAGGSHNALFVATARNHLYAFDADSRQLLWDTIPCHDHCLLTLGRGGAMRPIRATGYLECRPCRAGG
jgi:hypothetical protein